MPRDNERPSCHEPAIHPLDQAASKITSSGQNVAGQAGSRGPPGSRTVESRRTIGRMARRAVRHRRKKTQAPHGVACGRLALVGRDTGDRPRALDDGRSFAHRRQLVVVLLVASDAGRLGCLAMKRPSQCQVSHIQQRTVQGGRHIALRIPHVSLVTDHCLFDIRMGDLTDPGFDNFPECAEAEHGHDDQIRQQPPFHVAPPPKNVDKRQGHKKPEAEMDNPVEMIAVKAEPSIQPKSGRYFRIGLVHRDGVERQPGGDEDVRRVGQGEGSMRQEEHGDKPDRQDVGAPPDTRIQGRDPSAKNSPAYHANKTPGIQGLRPSAGTIPDAVIAVLSHFLTNGVEWEYVTLPQEGAAQNERLSP